MFGKLKGYKTYITGALTIAGAVTGYLTGDVALADGLQLVVTALLGMFIRDGINSTAARR
jgi:uncharacterized membrane protein AbrB (regulator of aidB expression)